MIYYILTSVEVDTDLSLHLDTSTLSYQVPLADKILLKQFSGLLSMFSWLLSLALSFLYVYFRVGKSLFIF